MDSTVVLSGRVDNKRRKDDLVQIAEVLGVPDFNKAANKDKIVAKIKKYINENEDRIANEPRFQGLVVYRPGSVGAKKRGKTSAEKASEDTVEANKKEVVPAGCAPFS